MTRLVMHHPPTSSRAQRTAQLVQATALALGLANDQVTRLALSGLLHDVGKLNVDRTLLNYPLELDGEQWAAMQNHVVIAEIIPERVLDFLEEDVLAITDHHEYYNGGGYPSGRPNNSGITSSQLVGVTSAYVAMTALTPRRPPLSRARALAQLRKEAGVRWNPVAVDALAEIVHPGMQTEGLDIHGRESSSAWRFLRRSFRGDVDPSKTSGWVYKR